MSLVGNLRAPLDNVRAVPEQGKRLLGSPDGAGEGARLHNPLDPLSADIGNDPEQAVAIFDLGRFIDKESGIKAHNAALSKRGDSATRKFAERCIAKTLTSINLTAREPLPARTGGPIPHCPGTGPLSPSPPGS